MDDIVEQPTEASAILSPSNNDIPVSYASTAGASEHETHDIPEPRILTEDDLPGYRSFEGREFDPADVREVISLLDKAGIPACVVDVYALCYYGAGRLSYEWNICVPAKDLDTAAEIFNNDERYAQARPSAQRYRCILHYRPTFTLKGVGFYFILVRSSDRFIEPGPDCWELSSNGIPYPKMHHFARSLLVLQEHCDLNDFIDGMNLDKEWAESNVDFDDLQDKGRMFTIELNAELEKNGVFGRLQLGFDYRRMWDQAVDEKDKRIEPMKQGRYKTRWRRIKNDTDPRTRVRPL